MNADVRPIRTAAEMALADAFEVSRHRLPGDADFDAARARAIDQVIAAGLPNRRIEQWKYTDLRTLVREIRDVAAAPGAAEIEAAKDFAPQFDGDTIVLVNGRVVPELSACALPEGVSAIYLGEALKGGKLAIADGVEGDFIRALNTAFVTDGVVLRVEAGVKLERPLHVASVQVGEAAFVHTRVSLSLGEGAEAMLIESQSGDDAAHQATSVVDLDVAAGATLAHVTIQDLGREAVALGALQARLGERSRLDTIGFSIGAAVGRQDVRLTFAGAHASASVNAIALAGGRRHLDTTLVVDHLAPGCESRELLKTVLAGEARAVYQGKIVVEPQAQKTDGKMMMRALMLSEGPEADMKPELEIFADDVVCGHGATAGAIDEELLFYLRSRGIPEDEAQTLMVHAFLGEVLETVPNEELREALSARATVWLAERG
jgi:Fe-S cluster assembly protein SufD